jgi:signal transduction histidine kinase/HAMP domain-containing protein
MINRLIRGLPLRRKMARAAMLAAAGGLVLAVVALALYDQITFVPRVRSDAEAQLALMQTVTTPALLFGDAKAAQENLASLHTLPEIVSATVYDSTGREMARYRRNPGEYVAPPARMEAFAQLEQGSLRLLEPVVVDGRLIGWIGLRYRLPPLRDRLAEYALFGLVLLLALSVAGWLILRVLERSVTSPLLTLAGVTRHIEKSGDPAARVPVGESDEIGALSDGINRMLARLEEQQNTLQTNEARLRLAFHAATMRPWTIEGSPEALRAFEERVHPDDRDRIHQALHSALQDGNLDIDFRSAGPEDAWLSIKGQAHRDDRSKVVRLLGVEQDVTDRRRLELQLIQSQKMEAIGTLAGGIAHDFNNLLTGMIGYLGFAQRALPADSKVRNDVQQAERAARRAADLTARLLAYARRQMVRPVAVDINQTVGGVDPLLQRILGEHIRLKCSLAADTWPSRMDVTQLEQVLVNMAVNARDAMPDGGVLRFVTRNMVVSQRMARDIPELLPGEYAVIDVEDTGTGMDNLTLSRIFEPFFTTKPVGQGTGLGLSMCFGIVKQAGGHILVTSAPGKGTRFSVLLPRLTDGVLAKPPADGTAPVATLEPGTESVMFVEDDPVVRELAVRTLRTAGYEVIEADGLRQAMAAARATPRVDLVITDLIMPDGRGSEVAEGVRRLHPHMRLLYISGYSELMATQLGATSVPFLAKPFSPHALTQAARTALVPRVTHPV